MNDTPKVKIYIAEQSPHVRLSVVDSLPDDQALALAQQIFRRLHQGGSTTVLRFVLAEWIGPHRPARQLPGQIADVLIRILDPAQYQPRDPTYPVWLLTEIEALAQRAHQRKADTEKERQCKS
jgi:hypothetical protein